MSQSHRDLLVRGIAAAKAGDRKEARFFLEWLLRLDPPLDEKMDAWYWMSEISEDTKEQRDYLEEILANNLGDTRARRRLAIVNGEINPEEIIDPDRLKRMTTYTQQEATAHRFTCPKCGGRMTYTADGQSLTCEFCATRHQIGCGNETVKDNFIAVMATARGHLKPTSRLSFFCQGCGVDFFCHHHL